MYMIMVHRFQIPLHSMHLPLFKTGPVAPCCNPKLEHDKPAKLSGFTGLRMSAPTPC